jgi:hypothetical protein
VHGQVERLGRGQARGERVVHQQAPHVAERNVTDQLFNIHPAVTERAAFLVRFGDLGLERDHALESRLEVGHRCLLFLALARRVMRQSGLASKAGERTARSRPRFISVLLFNISTPTLRYPLAM